MENDEEELVEFKRKLTEVLKDLSYIGASVQRKSDKLYMKIENNLDFDATVIENVGIGIMSIMKFLKGNMAAIIRSLESDLKEINKNRTDKLFEEMCSKLFEYTKTVVTVSPTNELVFAPLCDKETMVELPLNEHKESQTSDLDHVINLNSSVITISTDSECTPSTSEVHAGGAKTISLSLKKSLIKSDTQNTDDECWHDTLNRSTSIFNDSFCKPDIQTCEDDDVFDRETVKMSQDRASTIDDEFIDGPSTLEVKIGAIEGELAEENIKKGREHLEETEKSPKYANLELMKNKTDVINLESVQNISTAEVENTPVFNAAENQQENGDLELKKFKGILSESNKTDDFNKLENETPVSDLETRNSGNSAQSNLDNFGEISKAAEKVEELDKLVTSEGKIKDGVNENLDSNENAGKLLFKNNVFTEKMHAEMIDAFDSNCDRIPAEKSKPKSHMLNNEETHSKNMEIKCVGPDSEKNVAGAEILESALSDRKHSSIFDAETVKIVDSDPENMNTDNTDINTSENLEKTPCLIIEQAENGNVNHNFDSDEDLELLTRKISGPADDNRNLITEDTESLKSYSTKTIYNSPNTNTIGETDDMNSDSEKTVILDFDSESNRYIEKIANLSEVDESTASNSDAETTALLDFDAEPTIIECSDNIHSDKEEIVNFNSDSESNKSTENFPYQIGKVAENDILNSSGDPDPKYNENMENVSETIELDENNESLDGEKTVSLHSDSNLDENFELPSGLNGSEKGDEKPKIPDLNSASNKITKDISKTTNETENMDSDSTEILEDAMDTQKIGLSPFTNELPPETSKQNEDSVLCLEDIPNPYSVETEKLESDEETSIDSILDIFSEHNYSCPSPTNTYKSLSDLDATDCKRESDEDSRSCKSDAGNISDSIISEHNYSNPCSPDNPRTIETKDITVSEKEEAAYCSSDSDATNIGSNKECPVLKTITIGEDAQDKVENYKIELTSLLEQDLFLSQTQCNEKLSSNEGPCLSSAIEAVSETPQEKLESCKIGSTGFLEDDLFSSQTQCSDKLNSNESPCLNSTELDRSVVTSTGLPEDDLFLSQTQSSEKITCKDGPCMNSVNETVRETPQDKGDSFEVASTSLLEDDLLGSRMKCGKSNNNEGALENCVVGAPSDTPQDEVDNCEAGSPELPDADRFLTETQSSEKSYVFEIGENFNHLDSQKVCDEQLTDSGKCSDQKMETSPAGYVSTVNEDSTTDRKDNQNSIIVENIDSCSSSHSIDIIELSDSEPASHDTNKIGDESDIEIVPAGFKNDPDICKDDPELQNKNESLPNVKEEENIKDSEQRNETQKTDNTLLNPSSKIEKEDFVAALENILESAAESKSVKEGDSSDTHSLSKVKGDIDKSKLLVIKLDDCLQRKLDDTTIWNISDAESKISLLDVTMEEFLSSGGLSDTECNTDPQNTKSTNKQVTELHIKKEMPEINEDVLKSPTANDLGDELLALLREVDAPPTENTSTNNQFKVDNTSNSQDAEEIFRKLQETSDDISDSDCTDEDLADLSDLFPEENNVTENVETKKIYSDVLKKSNMVDCYVDLERLPLSVNEVIRYRNILDNSVDRLCDLTTLVNKKKCDVPVKKAGRSKKLKRKKDSCLSDISNSDSSDIEIRENRSCSPLSADLDKKLEDILASAICKDLGNSTNSDSSGSETDVSGSNTKKKGKAGKGQKRKLSKEEKLKKSWRNDPLLRGKLNSDSNSDNGSDSSNSGKSHRNKKRKTGKYEHDTDFDVVTEHIVDTDSEMEDFTKSVKIKLEENTISPIKRNLPVSDSSDTDSDIEFIPLKIKTPLKDGEDPGPSPSQKGRRNIRALMSNESLAEATKRANKEEQMRIERLDERRFKMSESLSQSFNLSQSEELEPFILDFDEKTGEPLVKVYRKLTSRLKPHQKIGVQFMWDSCYETISRLKEDPGSGCILAHCMGLGKTFQVLTLIHTLFSHDETNTKHVLVVCPLSTVSNWKKEFDLAFKDIKDHSFRIYTIADRKETAQKYEIVKKWHLRKKGVLVLGYEGFEILTNEIKLDKVSTNLKNRMLEALIDPGPDLVVCDEGHLLRNKNAQKSLALNKIRTRRRIVLTGTPLQNNLLEYYHMVQFVKPNLLGNMKEFKTNFVHPIVNGQYEDSTKDDIRLMKKRTHVLHELLKKTIDRIEVTELEKYLPKMLDHAVFVQLNQVQVDLYNAFSEIIQKNHDIKTNKKGFLSDYYVFQYICTHPHLLAIMEKMRNKKIKERDLITNEQENSLICNMDGWWKPTIPNDAANKIEYGHKMLVLKSIIEECEEIGDKVLVFSQCLGELDLIEHFLNTTGTVKCPSWKKRVDYYRMDGTVIPEERSFICDKFNSGKDRKIRLLLMSTKVGGLGLNLTAANRVIIMTVNWNPSYDIQSVFRVYRFGQKKEVFVYRLISLDTMEEKAYQRQVTKLAISHRVVDKYQIMRHYKSTEIQELYSCKPNADEPRPISNVPEDEMLAKLILKLPFIFKYHEHQALLANIPEDNLNEQEQKAAWDEFRLKDVPKEQPPPPNPPSVPLTNGPTSSMAFSLGRTNLNQITTNNLTRRDLLGVAGEQSSQYYFPKNSNYPLMQIRDELNKLLDRPTLQQTEKVPSDTTIMLDSNKKTENAHYPKSQQNALNQDPLYIPGTAKKTHYPKSQQNVLNQDPLYIPETVNNLANYGQVWPNRVQQLNDSTLSAPEVNNPMDKSTGILNQVVTKDPLGKKSVFVRKKWKGKSINPKTFVLPEKSVVLPTITLDDDNPTNSRGVQIKENMLPSTIPEEKGSAQQSSKYQNQNKRKLNETTRLVNPELLKRMKRKPNKAPNGNGQIQSISLLDNDDEVVPKPSSKTGCLSEDVLKNLELGGITIQKIKKTGQNNNDIITLD